ncbi:MAG: amphi-Trp domain-containing protein [Acidobacteriota bacterium]
MSKRELDFKAVLVRPQVACFVEDLLEGLKQGLICVQKDAEYVVLHPTELIKVELEASEKKDKCKLCFEMSWKSEMEIKGEARALKITSTLPSSPAVETAEPASPAEQEQQPEAEGSEF